MRREMRREKRREANRGKDRIGAEMYSLFIPELLQHSDHSFATDI